jgi:hypothetical protein
VTLLSLHFDGAISYRSCNGMAVCSLFIFEYSSQWYLNEHFLIMQNSGILFEVFGVSKDASTKVSIFEVEMGMLLKSYNLPASS